MSPFQAGDGCCESKPGREPPPRHILNRADEAGEGTRLMATWICLMTTTPRTLCRSELFPRLRMKRGNLLSTRRSRVRARAEKARWISLRGLRVKTSRAQRNLTSWTCSGDRGLMILTAFHCGPWAGRLAPDVALAGPEMLTLRIQWAGFPWGPVSVNVLGFVTDWAWSLWRPAEKGGTACSPPPPVS